MCAVASGALALEHEGASFSHLDTGPSPGTGPQLAVAESGERDTRTLVVTEDPLYGEGVKMLLQEAGHRAVFRIDCIERAHRFCAADTEERRHTVLWFVDVLDHETFGATSGLRKASATGLCVVADSVDVELVEQLVRERGGRFGLLLRTQRPDLAQIMRMIAQLSEGASVIDQRVLLRLAASSERQALANLSAMDERVLELIAAGFRNAEIARRTRRSEKAVEKHVGRLFAKLGLDAQTNGHLDRRVAAAKLFYSARRIPSFADAA